MYTCLTILVNFISRLLFTEHLLILSSQSSTTALFVMHQSQANTCILYKQKTEDLIIMCVLSNLDFSSAERQREAIQMTQGNKSGFHY